MARIDQPTLEDGPEAWLVYGDALQAEGETPRDRTLGELVALHDAPSRRETFVEAHADTLLGPAAPHRAKLDVTWRWCVPETVSLRVGPGDDAGALMAALLASPIAADMHTLRIVGVPTRDADRIDLSPAVAQLNALPPTCTALELVDERARTTTRLVATFYDAGENLVRFGSLDAVWAAKHLRSVSVVTGAAEQIELGTIDAPALERFELLSIFWPMASGQASDQAQAMGRARWPNLRHLALRLPEAVTYSWPMQFGAYVRVPRYDEENEYAEDYGDDDGYTEPAEWGAELGPVLEALGKTKIERLALTDFHSGETLVAALAEHGLPPTLRHLDLSHADLDAETLLGHRAVFAGLETLDVRGTQVPDAGALAGLGPKVLAEPGGGSRYEFAVGME